VSSIPLQQKGKKITNIIGECSVAIKIDLEVKYFCVP